MFSSPRNKFQFILGVMFAITLYAIASVVFLIAVNSVSFDKERPIHQEVTNILSVRTPQGIILKFTSLTHSNLDSQMVYMIRSLYNTSAKETTLLPGVAVIVNKGAMELRAAGIMPHMPSGVWHYQRAFTYRPMWSMNDKIALYPPIIFKVCDEMWKECR